MNSSEYGAQCSIDIFILARLTCNRDTVNSVGLFSRRLPFTTNNPIVRTLRHAIALDERRAKFKANHWNPPEPEPAAPGAKPQVSSPVQETASSNGKGTNAVASPKSASVAPKKIRNQALRAMEKQFSGPTNLRTDVEEVGCEYIEVREHN